MLCIFAMNILNLIKNLFSPAQKSEQQQQKAVESKYFYCPMCGWRYDATDHPAVCRNHRCGIRF